MEVSSTNKNDEDPKLNVDIDDSIIKENIIEVIESTKERSPIDDDLLTQNSNIKYDDDDEDSEEDIAVITNISSNVDSSPAKNMFNIKTISNTQIHSNYKISKTAIDLEHPGNINGVPTIDYDLSKLNDDCKPWKKPGADVSDFFNYGFTEDTWLLYCEKQKALRLTHESSAIKTLSGLSNFGYNLSGSHMHLGFNRINQKNSKGGLIDVIGCQQNGDFKNKHNDMGMSNKISTIPVQTGHMNSNQNQSGNYMSGLTNQAISNNLLNPIMSALAMGMIPNGSSVSAVLGNQQNMPIDTKISQYSMDGGGSRNYAGHSNSNWGNNNQNYERQNSVDSMHSHEDYNDKKPYIKIERGSRREEPRRYRSRERREKSAEKRRRTRSRSRERGHDNKYSRSGKNTRTPEESRRNKKHSRSRDRASSTESSKRRRAHRSSKKHRQSKSRSQESRKDRRHRRKSPTDKHKREVINVDMDKSDSIAENIKREKEAVNNS